MNPRTAMAKAVGCAVLLGSALSCATAPEPHAPQVRVATDRQPWQLRRPIGQMTPAELWHLGDSLYFVEGPEQRRGCAQGNCDARFDAIVNQNPGPSSLGPDGIIVARIVNTGSPFFGADEGNERVYGVPKARGGVVYYMLGLSDGSGGWRWSIRKADRNDTVRRGPEEIDDGSWSACTHEPQLSGHPRRQSMFWSCSRATVTFDDPIAPGWLECEQGCCTAGQ